FDLKVEKVAHRNKERKSARAKSYGPGGPIKEDTTRLLYPYHKGDKQHLSPSMRQTTSNRNLNLSSPHPYLMKPSPYRMSAPIDSYSSTSPQVTIWGLGEVLRYASQVSPPWSLTNDL
ncbi:hypothetical protein CR513_59447, partial [Mucuna pruriens]